MTSAAQLLDPEVSFGLAEHAMASEYARLARTDEQPSVPDVDSLERSVVLLELLVLGGCIAELMAEDGVESPTDIAQNADEFVGRIRDRCGLVLTDIWQDVVRYLPVQVLTQREPAEPVSPSRVSRVVRSVLEFMPVDWMQHIAAERHQESWGHRSRVAHDALRAFVHRNDPRHRRQITLIGEKYVQGLLSVSEVATLLNIESADACFILEKYGFARSIDRVMLTEERRRSLLATQRSDRLSRAGEVAYDSEHTDRDVIASERIEEIDARQWVRQIAH